MRTTLIGGVCVLVALTATACGRMGELETPSGQRRSTSDIVEPATVNRPPSQVPVDGGSNNPFGGSGSRPDAPEAR